MESNALPSRDEAAAALRDAERAQSSINALPARPWFYPALAVISAGMTFALLLLGPFGVVIVALCTVAITLVTRKHGEVIGVQEKGSCGREWRDMAAMAPLLVVYVFGCGMYTQQHRPWELILAAVALAADMLLLGYVRRLRRVS